MAPQASVRSRGFKRARSFASRPALKGLVGSVAVGLVAGVLAAAQPQLLGLRHRELHRGEFGDLVRTVAKRLAFRSSAAAPPVIAGGNLHRVWGLLRNVGFGHERGFLRNVGFGHDLLSPLQGRKDTLPGTDSRPAGGSITRRKGPSKAIPQYFEFSIASGSFLSVPHRTWPTKRS